MSYKIEWNKPKPYKDFYLGLDKPIRSSRAQDLIKKTAEETEVNNQEIRDSIEDYKNNMKIKDFVKTPKCSLGTLSLLEKDDCYENSDSISRNTHPFVKCIVLRDKANDKSKLDIFVYTKKNAPKIEYRTEVGEYVNNSNFIALNDFIKDVLKGRRNLFDIKSEDIFEEYQIKYFISQLEQAKIWVDELDLPHDDGIYNACMNLISNYEQTYDKAEDEVKTAIRENTYATLNHFPYHLHHKILDFIYVNYGDSLTTEHRDKIKNIVVDGCEFFGSYLINSGIKPKHKICGTWLTYYNKSKKVSGKNNVASLPKGGALIIPENEWKSEIKEIFIKESNNIDDKIDELEFFFRPNENEILKSFSKLSYYTRNHKQIKPTFYPIMLKWENERGELTKEELSLLIFHSTIDSIVEDLYPSWSTWQGNILKRIQDKPKESLSDILKKELIYDDVKSNWYNKVIESMIYDKYKKNKKFGEFALIDKILSYSSFKATLKQGLVDTINSFKIHDNGTRTLEHWVSRNLDDLYSELGGNMFFMPRPDNVMKNDKSITEKLESGFSDIQTTLAIIYHESQMDNLVDCVYDLVNKKSWKDTFINNTENNDYIAHIQNRKDSNYIFKLRKIQLELTVKMLHE